MNISNNIFESKFLRKKMGIYKITNLVNGKFYIGSSRNLYKRIRGHKNDLIGDRHGNILLQSSWNKYGKENFSFEILEFVDSLLQLQPIEQKYINNTQCANKKIGFNLNEIAGPASDGSKWAEDKKYLRSQNYQEKFGKEYRLLSPDNQIICGKGISALIKKYNLHEVLIRRLIQGASKYYNDWINLNNLPDTIKVISPRGIIYEIFENNLWDFALFHNIPPATFNKKKLTQKNCYHIQGWFVYNNQKKIKLLSPIDEIVELYSYEINEFAEKHDLIPQILQQVINKKIKHYKGWSLLETPLKKIYLQNADGRKIVSWFGKLRTDCNKIGISNKRVEKLCNKKIKEYNGWTIQKSNLQLINK